MKVNTKSFPGAYFK